MSIDTPTPAGQTALVRYEQSEADLVAAAKAIRAIAKEAS